MKGKSIIASLLLLIVTLSCKKKDDPIETTQNPVFSFNGKINGASVSLYSGVNNYFMYSDFKTDANNLREFIGELKPRSCGTGCTSAIKIILKDYRLLNLTPTIIDSSIRAKFYNYCTPNGTPNSYSVTFVPQFIGGTPQTYNWTFHNGNSSAANPVKIYSEPGKYSVCLNINSTTSCNSGLCNFLKIGQTGNTVESGFTSSAPIGNVISFTAQPVLGVPPYTYNWNFGDANNSTLANPTHTYSANGVYLVSLTVTDSKNNTATFQNNVNTTSPGTCMTKFTFVKSPIANANNLANIIVEWTDANGIVFSSSNNFQPTTSGFQIKSVEEYLVNENGQKTKKIIASFNCTLYNGTSSILVEDAEVTFAVAYP